MKKIILALLASLALMGCDSKSSGGGGTVATTPLELQCINGQAYCNTNQYYNHYGFRPYHGMYNYAYDYTSAFISRGLCGCPSGYLPTYNDSYGLGCVMQNQIQVYTATVSNWSFGYGYGYGFQATYYYTPAPQSPPSNWAQHSNVPNNSLNYNTCAQNITRSCFLDQANNCDPGSSCRQVNPSSNLGVCARH